MFSSIFGKRRSSPVEDDTPPIPGPKPGDSFVIVSPTPSSAGGLYPNVSGNFGPGAPAPFPSRPAPPTPMKKPSVENFHYLQGVPFTMSKELQMATNKDAFATEISDLLAFLTNKVNINGYDYDFSTEKSVLKEC